MEMKLKTHPNLKNTTVQELGAVLPHGTFDQTLGELRTQIQTRTWNLKAERELSRSLLKAKTPARKVSITLARMCPQLGGVETVGDDRNAASDITKVQGLFIADVTYAYVWLRIQAVGSKLDIGMTCRYCKHEGIVPVDLGEMDVATVIDTKAMRTDVTLESPLKFGKDETVNVVTVVPARWAAVEQAADKGEHLESAMVRSSIIARDGVSWSPSLEQLDEMSIKDVQKLFKVIDDISPGPAWLVEAECERCHKESAQFINWMAENFFTASSR